MPDDDRRIEYVPVDPKAYGLGLLLAWLYNNRKSLVAGCGTLLILACVVAGITGLVSAGLNLVRYGTIDERTGQARVAETQLAVEQTALSATQGAQQVSAAQGLARIAELRRQGLSIAGDGQRYELNSEQFLRVTWVAFAPEGLHVYFESTQPVSDYMVREACLVWQGQQEGPGISKRDWRSGDHLQSGLAALPLIAQVSARPLGNGGSYKGMVLFPYDVLPEDASTMGPDTTYYFSLQCKGAPQIPLFNLANPEGWSVAEYVDVYAFDLLAREQNEGANSSMRLVNVEHVPGEDSIRIGVAFELDDAADGFSLAAPDAVYVQVAGETIAPIDWGGASQVGYPPDWGTADEIISMSCWDCSAGNPPYPVWFEFAGVWDKIARAGCFEFRYGTFYNFPQVCIAR